MDKSKIKFMVIALLACVNLALAVNLLSARYHAAVIPKRTVENTLAFLDRCGIWAEESVIPRRAAELYQLASPRDVAAETAVARALLGASERTEQGGGIGVYRSEKGEATFRRGALVSIALSGVPAPETGDDAERAARDLLDSAGILPEDYGLVVENGRDGVTVRFVTEVGGARLRNAVLEVCFTGGEARISGCAFTNAAKRMGGEARQVTALLADFGAYAAAYELDVSLIVAVEPAYFHTVDSGGGALLVPALYIKTDGGDFLLNGLDGSLLSGG